MIHHEIEYYIAKVNRIFNCDIMAENRKGNNVLGRIALSSFFRNNLKMTFQSIADETYKTHATIMHHCREHESLFKYNKDYKNKYNELTQNEIIPLILCKPCNFNIKIRKFETL